MQLNWYNSFGGRGPACEYQVSVTESLRNVIVRAFNESRASVIADLLADWPTV